MKVTISVDKGKTIVDLSGSMYVEDASMLREKLIASMESGHKNLIIKLNNVDYIDSSGLGVLVAIQKKTMQMQGSVIISGAKGAVKELFELTRLNQVFDMQ